MSSGHFLDRVLTSPLKRAPRTCELAFPGLVPEIGPTSLSGSTVRLKDCAPRKSSRQRSGWNIFQDGVPNGETLARISDRANRLITRLPEISGNIARFTHGHFGRVLATSWIGLPVSQGRHFQLGTVSLSILSLDAHHLDVPVIALWNAGILQKLNREVSRRLNDGRTKVPKSLTCLRHQLPFLDIR